jgi:hypothetical protein
MKTKNVDIGEVYSMAQKWHNSLVMDICADILDKKLENRPFQDYADDESVFDSEDIEEYLHEIVENHVIYNRDIMLILLASSNDQAHANEGLGEGLDRNGIIDYAAFAYCALEADVKEEMDRIGLAEADTREELLEIKDEWFGEGISA